MIPPHYPSDKIIVPYDKIRSFLLKPGSKHYSQFYNVGYRPDDDYRLFKDIEEQFDAARAVEPRTYPVTGELGYTVYMYLGITNKQLFLTAWKIIPESDLPQLVSVFHVRKKRGKEYVQ